MKNSDKRVKSNDNEEEVKVVEGHTVEEVQELKALIEDLKDRMRDYDFVNEENAELRDKMAKLQEKGLVNEHGEEIIKF
jgi:protein-arginine kinase activator protein McsA